MENNTDSSTKITIDSSSARESSVVTDSVVTTDTLKGGQTPLIQFRFNETLKHVTYLIEIEKSEKKILFILISCLISCFRK